jgi:hypothetical protein
VKLSLDLGLGRKWSARDIVWRERGPKVLTWRLDFDATIAWCC